MPSRWLVSFDGVRDPAPIRPEHLHAVVSRWLDEEHAAARKGYATSPLRRLAGGGWGIEVGVVDDDLTPRLLAGIDLARRHGVRLGPVKAGIGGGPDEDGLTCIAAAPWADLWAGGTARGAWDFEFLTPTTFRSGDRYQPLPVANSVFGHLRRVWKLFAPRAPEVGLDVEPVVVASLEGHTEEVMLRRRPVPGFVGRVLYRAVGVDDGAATMLDRCARLAPVCGVGAHTTAGLGVVEVG